MIAEEGRGVLLYIAQEGRGHRAAQQAARLRAAGPRAGHGRGQHRARLPARPARLRHRRPDPRATWASPSIRLLTNNPKKIVGLEGYGLSVVDRVPIEMAPGDDNVDYLRAKRDKMGHILHHQDLRFDEEAADGAEPSEPRRAGVSTA